MQLMYDKISNYNEEFYNEIYNKIKKAQKNKINQLTKKNKQSSLLGIHLLNELLNKLGINYYDQIINYNINGKPSMKNYKNIHFSISHDKNYVICAVSKNRIGIDLVYLKNKKINSTIFLNKEELDLCNNNKLLFSIKESYIKMEGKSILNIKNINIKEIIKNKKVHIFKCTQISNYLITICTYY